MSVKLVICLLLQTAVAILAGVRSIPETILRERSMGNKFLRWEPRLDGRIVGGQAINITEAPYQIYLIAPPYSCGASLISKEWILTAAHCIVSVRDPKRVSVRLGSTDRNKGGQLLGIQKIVQHEKYNEKTFEYDVALLQLENPIEFDETKKAVELPEQDQEFEDGEMCYVSGWGNTKNIQESNKKLRQAQVPLVNQKECDEKNKFIASVTDSMICAGYPEGGKDSCQGDSGGPLVNRNGVLVGVVSWGHGCAEPNFPGVYARVAYVREWIKNHSGV